MTRLFCVGILVVATLFAVPAFASVPFAANCTVQWFGGPTSTVVRLCPKGDWDALDVTVMDQFGLPIAGQTVTATLDNGAELCASPISGITNASGYVRLTVKSGTLSTATTRIVSGYTVSCMGYTIGGGSVDIMSSDYNCSPKVDALDFSFFAQDYLKVPVRPRSDFNNDAAVDALDYSIWSLHYTHQS
jgi:Bacterial Ig-like domain (group 1)